MATRDSANRHLQANLVRTIGERLHYARETLCNLSQQEAARRLGYSNPSKLSKIERATDTNSIPLWVIKKAAQIYSVSIDFLFGLTEDWEPSLRMSAERETAEWVFDELQRQRVQEIAVLDRINRQHVEIARAANTAFESAEKVEIALRTFREHNPTFDTDMLGSAKLVAAVTLNAENARNFRASFRRLKLERATAVNQPALFDDEEG